MLPPSHTLLPTTPSFFLPLSSFLFSLLPSFPFLMFTFNPPLCKILHIHSIKAAVSGIFVAFLHHQCAQPGNFGVGKAGAFVVGMCF